MKNKFIKSMIALLALTVSSCAPSSNTPKRTTDVIGVSLDVHALTLYSGESYSFTATVEPDNATNKDVTWTVSNNSAGTITNNGVFTALEAAHDSDNLHDDSADDYQRSSDQPAEIEHRPVEYGRVVASATDHEYITGDHDEQTGQKHSQPLLVHCKLLIHINSIIQIYPATAACSPQSTS